MGAISTELVSRSPAPKGRVCRVKRPWTEPEEHPRLRNTQPKKSSQKEIEEEWPEERGRKRAPVVSRVKTVREHVKDSVKSV